MLLTEFAIVEIACAEDSPKKLALIAVEGAASDQRRPGGQGQGAVGRSEREQRRHPAACRAGIGASERQRGGARARAAGAQASDRGGERHDHRQGNNSLAAE